MTKNKLMKAITISDGKIIIDGIDLSNYSIVINDNIGGNLKARHIGGNLIAWNVSGFNSQKHILGDNRQWSIGGNNTQWDVEGNNSQAFVKGDNNQRDVTGNNHQQSVGGHNSQGSVGKSNYQCDVGGDNHQFNVGGNNSQFDIKGNSKQRNVLGKSSNSKHYTDSAGNTQLTLGVDTTDGVWMAVLKVKKIRGGIEYISGRKFDGQKVYLVKSPNISYHSYRSLDNAKEGYKRKRENIVNGIGKWVSTLTNRSIITRETFRRATGACIPGVEAWCDRVGISKGTTRITFKKFKELAAKYPTQETELVMAAVNILKGGKKCN